MANIESIPFELRSKIYALARPSSVTVTIKESADLTVTSVSSPPALLTTTKETRTAALKWALQPYSILVGDDYTDLFFGEDITLHLNIIPSDAEHLSITWTELYTVLSDALLDAKRVVIECSEPKRLARLFMLPEVEFVRVGASCVEKGLYGSEIIASDRDTREALRSDIIVCVNEHKYVLEEETVAGFFGESFTTKGFSNTSALYLEDTIHSDSVEAEALCLQDSLIKLEGETVGHEAEALYVGGAEVELQLVELSAGMNLTEEALERFRAESEKLFSNSVYAAKSDPGSSVMPVFD